MAVDPGLLDLMRGDLADLQGIREVRMFGGLCFMREGHMLCGLHKGGAMYRVGKASIDKALAIPGASPMAFTGRTMGGLIDIDADGMADDKNRAAWLKMACDFTDSLPPKLR